MHKVLLGISICLPEGMRFGSALSTKQEYIQYNNCFKLSKNKTAIKLLSNTNVLAYNFEIDWFKGKIHPCNSVYLMMSLLFFTVKLTPT